MGALSTLLSLAAAAGEGGELGRWANLADNRAGGISLTGIGAVFAGLLLLFGFITLMGWLCYGRRVKNPERYALCPTGEEPEPSREEVPSAPDATEDVEAEEPETEDPDEDPDQDPDEGPLVLPETPATLVPASMISAAVLALRLYEQGGLALGATRDIEVDGITRTATLLAVGYMNRVRVDGEEIAFSSTRIAPSEAA